MEIIAAFVAGALLGVGSLITWALCAANTMYEEKRIDEWLGEEADPEWRE